MQIYCFEWTQLSNLSWYSMGYSGYSTTLSWHSKELWGWSWFYCVFVFYHSCMRFIVSDGRSHPIYPDTQWVTQDTVQLYPDTQRSCGDRIDSIVILFFVILMADYCFAWTQPSNLSWYSMSYSGYSTTLSWHSKELWGWSWFCCVFFIILKADFLHAIFIITE